MWWGSTRREPLVKKLKLTEIFEECLYVCQLRLHFFFCPLSLHTITVHHLKGLETLFTFLQFQIRSQDQIHPFFKNLSTTLLLVLHAFMLHARPLVTQSLQTIFHIFHYHFVAPRSRHLQKCSRPVHKLRVAIPLDHHTYVTQSSQSRTAIFFRDVKTGGYPISPLGHVTKKYHVISFPHPI